VAFATAAQLVARSGAQVFLDAADVELEWPIPPIRERLLLEGLVELGSDLLPGCGFKLGAPPGGVDVALVFGDAVWRGRGELVYRVNASAWEGRITRWGHPAQWVAGEWPLGGLAAAGLAAAEVFKATMRKLRRYGRNPGLFDEQLAPVMRADLALAPVGAPCASDLGRFDVVSGGAISQALLYCLAQIPAVRGLARVIEPERSDATNMNRYMLLRRSRLGRLKAEDLATLDLGGLSIDGVGARFDEATVPSIVPLADRVLVGVDDIPSRWLVQAQWPVWLGIGATSHFGAMCSWHEPGTACAHCLHPRDEAAAGPIPTAAFVSFISGLMLAAAFIRAAGGVAILDAEQQEWLATLRADSPAWRTSVQSRDNCPLRCSSRIRRAA
jgi:hypothetical protein